MGVERSKMTACEGTCNEFCHMVERKKFAEILANRDLLNGINHETITDIFKEVNS
jgi:hypothetical protein